VTTHNILFQIYGMFRESIYAHFCQFQYLKLWYKYVSKIPGCRIWRYNFHPLNNNYSTFSAGEFYLEPRHVRSHSSKAMLLDQ